MGDNGQMHGFMGLSPQPSERLLEDGRLNMQCLERLIRVGKLIVSQDEKQSIIDVQVALKNIQARMSK